MTNRKTIAVLGGGSAGLTAARTAHQLGARVLFFMGDHADHASLCINAGCMPSKAMFEPIDATHRAKRHGWLEIQPRDPEGYLAQIVVWKNREIAAFRDHRQQKIRAHEADDFKVIRTNARFVEAHKIQTNNESYAVDGVILATGSVNSIPDLGEERVGPDGVWTNNEILDNTTLPASLTIIGAGAVSMEFSLRYARLGCAVTVVSRSAVLSQFPRKFGDRLSAIYEREGLRILTGREFASIKRGRDGLYTVGVEGPDRFETLTSERVLFATGRRPALANLNLIATGLHVGSNGKLEVGADMRVAGSEHIFVAGDALGDRMVVHQAHIEAGIAAENAVNGSNRKWARRSNLQVIFSDPEFAFAGQSMESAERAGHKVVVASAESRDIGKLHLAGDDLGFGEFVADADTRHLLGAGLLCDDASNLIHLPAYAIDHQHTVDDLASAEYYHPTKIEIVSEIGDALCRAFGGKPFSRAKE